MVFPMVFLCFFPHGLFHPLRESETPRLGKSTSPGGSASDGLRQKQPRSSAGSTTRREPSSKAWPAKWSMTSTWGIHRDPKTRGKHGGFGWTMTSGSGISWKILGKHGKIWMNLGMLDPSLGDFEILKWLSYMIQCFTFSVTWLLLWGNWGMLNGTFVGLTRDTF